MSTWVPVRETQLAGLEVVLRHAGTHAILITNHESERGVIVAVTPSPRDDRRWDIDKQGRLTFRRRGTGEVLGDVLT